ncbi:MAG: copper chaperone PCu(A)C [Alphaproteobacteria bacterium]|jgi:periplasmic copper chaperone A|nr:copper chaperone PCu(A)C [Alphaproteobacteria bacterium]
MLKSLFAAALLVTTILPANGHEEKSENFTISHPWSRATAPSQKVGAVFMEIKNITGKEDRLIGASSPDAESTEIHGHIREGDIMRMRRVDGGIAVPANGSVKLVPGGFHIMLIGLNAPLLEETTIPLTLTFEHAGSVEIEAVVESAGASRSGGATKMEKMDHSKGHQMPGKSK